MNVFLTLAFLFFAGSSVGWVCELIFRKFFSPTNAERKWINPGFCTGPYLPIYGFGLCILYLISSLSRLEVIQNAAWGTALLIFCMAVCMTAIEYVAGILMIRVFNVRLWDYRNEWGNIQGVICPLFSLIWTAVSALYFFLIHPHIQIALDWLSHNLAFSFFIGMFFGIFLLDTAHSMQVVRKLKQFAEEYQVIVRYETIKAQIRSYHDVHAQRYHFFTPFRSERPLGEHLRAMRETFESRVKSHRHFSRKK